MANTVFSPPASCPPVLWWWAAPLCCSLCSSLASTLLSLPSTACRRSRKSTGNASSNWTDSLTSHCSVFWGCKSESVQTSTHTLIFLVVCILIFSHFVGSSGQCWYQFLEKQNRSNFVSFSSTLSLFLFVIFLSWCQLVSPVALSTCNIIL